MCRPIFTCAICGGSDEHGVPITIRAKKEGVTPQDIVDRYHTLIKDSFKEFGISFDVYGRTSSPTHHQLASDFFRKLYDKHEFIEKTSMQYYDEEAHTFLAVTSRENALAAMRKVLTVTSVKNVEVHFRLQN